MAKGTGTTRNSSAASPNGVGTQAMAVTGGGIENQSLNKKGNGMVVGMNGAKVKAEVIVDNTNPLNYMVKVSGMGNDGVHSLTKKQAETLLNSINNSTTSQVRNMAKEIKKKYPESLSQLHSKIKTYMTEEFSAKVPKEDRYKFGYNAYGDATDYSFNKKTGHLNVVFEGKAYGDGFDRYNIPYTRLDSLSGSGNKQAPERVARILERSGYKVKKITLEQHYD